MGPQSVVLAGNIHATCDYCRAQVRKGAAAGLPSAKKIRPLILKKSRLCLQSIETSKGEEGLRKLFLNGVLLRDKLSGKVYFRLIAAFSLNSYISGIDPHLLVHYERHSFLRGTAGVGSLFVRALCRGTGQHCDLGGGRGSFWNRREMELLSKEGQCYFCLSVSY